MKTLLEVKEEVAARYSSRTFEGVLRDFEYGMGISKLMNEFEFMDKVVAEYARMAVLEAVETAKHHTYSELDVEGTIANTFRILGLPELK